MTLKSLFKTIICLAVCLIVLSPAIHPSLNAKDNDKTKDNPKEQGKSDDKPASPAGGDTHDDNRNKDKVKDKDESKEKEKPSTPPPKAKKEKSGTLKTFVKPYTDKDNPKHDDKSHHDRRGHESSEYSSVGCYEYENDDDYDDDDDSGWGDFFWDLWWELFFGDHGFRYRSCPYGESAYQGIYISSDPFISESYNGFALQMRTFYQKVESDLWGYGVYGKLMLPSGFSGDMYYNRYREEMDDATDTMNFFSMHFNFAGFASDTNTVFELGLGGAFLTDVEGTSHGSLSFQGKVSYFPREPWSLQVLLGYSASAGESLINLDATAGWHKNNWEIFVGYHSLINSGGANLDGPVIGLAIWF
ncbi:MAG: hypothetical protein HY811_12295 [Planctomycetes bacterium]|nr:hypothetical protein [Planctomycetota bacterium]